MLEICSPWPPAHPDLIAELAARRPVLKTLSEDHRGRLEAALDAERRELMRANEKRLASYREAAQRWAAAWPALEKEVNQVALCAAHDLVTARALDLLPFAP